MANSTVTKRIAIVTGAARRIGRGIALDLAQHGWSVCVHFSSSAADAEALVREIRGSGGQAAAVGADLAQASGPAHLVAGSRAALGAATALVNNASLFLDDTIETLDVDVWDRQLAINLRAPVLLSQAFADQLPEGVQGNIVNVIDQRVWRPTPEFLSYSISKAGLWSATRMLAQALAPRIRVNAVGPGPVLKSVYQTEAEFAAEARSTLLGHGAPPEEIAAAVRFILDARAMTGQMIALDGGQHLAWPRPRSSDDDC